MKRIKKELGQLSDEEIEIAIDAIKLHRLNKFMETQSIEERFKQRNPDLFK